MPTISVIIPTHNRRSLLKNTLDALQEQTHSMRDVEVIVVADGCTDDTLEFLNQYLCSYQLKVLEQSNRGPAAARNHGGYESRGSVLVFLDDDVVPGPCLIEAHLETHRKGPDIVVIGPYPSIPEKADNLLAQRLRFWWDSRFIQMTEYGYRFQYNSLHGGNFSIKRDLFRRIGGFDSNFWVHEDIELGMRLIKAQVHFCFSSNAASYHFVQPSFNSHLLRKRREGREDILLANKHPELFRCLAVFLRYQRRFWWRRFVRSLAFQRKAYADALMRFSAGAFSLLEQARLRHLWRILKGLLEDYWYWRGVADEIPTRQKLADWIRFHERATPQEDEVCDIDLKLGLEVAERTLDIENPMSAHVHYGNHLIGLIPATPGAEPLRGAHLRHILATDLAIPFLEAMALEGKLTDCATDKPKLAKNIRAMARWFLRNESTQIWMEHRIQWSKIQDETDYSVPTHVGTNRDSC